MQYNLFYGYSTAQPLNRSTAQPLNRSTAKKAKCKNLTAFTLLELMVVISIISILTLIAVPNFKRAYEDFSIKKTCGDVEEYCSGIQAYYLIMNEFMKDFQPKKINANIKWIFPSSFYKGSMMNIAPYVVVVMILKIGLGIALFLSFGLLYEVLERLIYAKNYVMFYQIT